MSPEFNAVYEAMLEEYPFQPRMAPPFFHPAQDESFRSIKKAVEEICEKRKVMLRHDAKYFLIANFYEMVSIPLLTVRGTQTSETIKNMIRTDIDSIVSSASSSSTAGPSEKDKDGISAGSIVKATAKLWDKLETNSAWL